MEYTHNVLTGIFRKNMQLALACWVWYGHGRDLRSCLEDIEANALKAYVMMIISHTSLLRPILNYLKEISAR